MKKIYTQAQVSERVNEAINRLQPIIWKQDGILKEAERKAIAIRIQDILIRVRDVLDNCKIIEHHIIGEK